MPSLLLNTAPLTLAAAGEGEPLINQGLELSAVGIGVVFTALISIWVLLLLLKLFRRETPTAKPAKTPAASPATKDDVDPETLAVMAASSFAANAYRQVDSETMAVITAAVTAVVRRPFRLRRVSFVSTPPSPAWAEHGRREIHTSHRLRKREQ